ncbi:MAG: dihydroorotate dehydrogenase electron transfer subunit [Nanoarchaeota archaeon]|nr:dihydroorotate dehydrogenase electron transfer subunit [Nanoarchaeota archaeon]
MHKVYKVKEVIRENDKAVSIILNGKINYKPGQFIMLWLPGVDEKPFAVSYLTKSIFGVTIEAKGIFTKKISKVKKGTKVGIRGPYGNGFSFKNNSIVVAGGLGMAPSLSLIKKIKNTTVIQGAKSKEYLLFLKNKKIKEIIEKNNNKIIYCTDDGSYGIHGFTTDILKEIINKKTNLVYTCGPEIMMKRVFEICEKNKIEYQASLERFCKCGLGICGSCAINDQLVCKDGPVFNSKQIRKLTELGKFARLKSGRKVKINEYYAWKGK